MGAYQQLILGNKAPESTDQSDASPITPEATKRPPRKERSIRLPRGITPQDAMEEFYIPDKLEREAIKAKAARNVPLLVDVLDNIQRPAYAVRSGILELAKSVKFQD